MKIAVWKTGHVIADTVADAFSRANYPVGLALDNVLNDDLSRKIIIGKFDAHVVYGILRTADKLLKEAPRAFCVDRGYFNPGHFDGYYRISYKGTQAKWHEGIPQKDIDFGLEDWKDGGGKILVCPPTEPVCSFFHISLEQFWDNYIAEPMNKFGKDNCILRTKLTQEPINWEAVKAVYTFNSSVGWEALRRGIPCISDTTHSIVGSYYAQQLAKLGLDYTFENVMKIPREPLFRAMQAHQFTLAEFANGKAWPLIQHYLSQSPHSLAMTQEKQPQQKLPPIASAAGQNPQ